MVGIENCGYLDVWLTEFLRLTNDKHRSFIKLWEELFMSVLTLLLMACIILNVWLTLSFKSLGWRDDEHRLLRPQPKGPDLESSPIPPSRIPGSMPRRQGGQSERMRQSPRYDHRFQCLEAGDESEGDERMDVVQVRDTEDKSNDWSHI